MSEETPAGILRPWAELLRLPNLFTVPGEALAGYVLAAGVLGEAAGWACLVVLLLYAAGLLLNDWFDLSRDAEQRPERPLPSGRVAPGAARNVGFGALVAGVAVAWLAGPAAAGIVATLTALCVLLYDAGLKHTAAGPVVMGLCRAGALLAGAAFAGSLGLPSVIAATTVFAYTCVLTQVARRETSGEPPAVEAWAMPLALASGAAAMLVVSGPSTLGLVALALAVIEAGYLTQQARAGRMAVPPFIGRMVRVMIMLQAAWALWPEHRAPTLAVLAALFVALRAGGEVAGRTFYGS